MILPMQDEETGAEPRVLSASISDPYLLLIRDDSSAFVAHMNSDDELEELEKTESALTSTKWVSGCLYADTTGLFGETQEDPGAKKIVMFLLSNTGALQVSDYHSTVFRTHSLTLPRYSHFQICPNPYILQKDYAIFLPY